METGRLAAEFKDQAFEYFKNDILRLGWNGEFSEHLKKYGLFETLKGHAELRKWTQNQLKEFTEIVVAEIKKDYVDDVKAIYEYETSELQADRESIEYYVNKMFLDDESIGKDEDLSEEAVQSYIDGYEKEIKRREPILVALKNILRQII